MVALQKLAFPLLGGRVINLKDAKPGKGISIGEGIESGAKENVLLDPVQHGPSQVVFSVTAARHQKCAQRCREGTVRPRWSPAQFFRIRRAKNTDRNRVLEDNGRVINLVCRTSQRNAERGP